MNWMKKIIHFWQNEDYSNDTYRYKESELYQDWYHWDLSYGAEGEQVQQWWKEFQPDLWIAV